MLTLYEDCDPELIKSIDKMRASLVGVEYKEIPGKQNHFCNPTIPEILPELE